MEAAAERTRCTERKTEVDIQLAPVQMAEEIRLADGA